ncbi:Peptidyl-prolyl cis-trans isomerase surA [Phocoenobacter uteri]|uniref:Peptidyl-prolyl cis-trans isomerase surA n=1 Tax=Phocoenobacter uteri TaxID=146806 RepID=A0A379C8J9_9PAST|nr:peptidylprolyl isomerase [Phocoenobacter uteri]MDG6882341.1 peptidylprolyl isomerase [Phocoenobacter uteri]SUB58499.1 Peptidyl-prolyl cis-trans isomerase surA [Phocoenobacter uteri]
MKCNLIKSSFLTLIALFATTQMAVAQERVEALVDGYMIMESQVKQQLGSRPDTPANHRKALEATIDDYLVQKAIKESGVQINYRTVNQAIENIASQNGITYGQLLDALDYQGISLNQYRQQIAHQMMMAQVRQVSIGKSIQVSPQNVQILAEQMLNDEAQKGKLKKSTAKQYRVSHILIKTNPILNDQQAKQKLQQIVADIKSGKMTFAQAATKNSKDYVSAIDGGDLGWNFPQAYDPRFAQRITSTPIGKISEPFQSKFGWHILKVTETRLKDTTKEVYLQEAYKHLFDEQAQEASQDWIKALRKKAQIEYVKRK